MVGRGFHRLVLGTLILGLLAVTARASPSGAGRIVFSSDREERPAIYVMDVDGSNVTRLTALPEGVWMRDIAISPDGQKIAFVSGVHEISVMNADGSNVTRLTTPGASEAPSFSPDGRRIAFCSNLGGFPHIDEQLYVMNGDGTNVTRLTNLQGICGDPKFSPDGRKIGFVLESFDNALDRQIYVMDADGSNVTTLRSSPTANRTPSFSPDGGKIVFASSSVGAGVVRSGIYVMNADGSHVIHLASVRVPSIPVNVGGVSLTLAVGGQESSPVYSPDGSKIAFSSLTPEGFGFQIYVMNADGSNLVLLTKPPGSSGHPAFIP